jgi:DNA-binding PadR family transcriptional regulator
VSAFGWAAAILPWAATLSTVLVCMRVRVLVNHERERLVLLRLLADGDLYGLELIERGHGLLKRGGIYVLLSRLEHRGLVASYDAEMTPARAGLPRRRYELTPTGRALAVLIATGRVL